MTTGRINQILLCVAQSSLSRAARPPPARREPCVRGGSRGLSPRQGVVASSPRTGPRGRVCRRPLHTHILSRPLGSAFQHRHSIPSMSRAHTQHAIDRVLRPARRRPTRGVPSSWVRPETGSLSVSPRTALASGWLSPRTRFRSPPVVLQSARCAQGPASFTLWPLEALQLGTRFRHGPLCWGPAAVL